MLQRFIEEKLPISACLNEMTFKKTLMKAKLGEHIDWNTLEQLAVGSRLISISPLAF